MLPAGNWRLKNKRHYNLKPRFAQSFKSLCSLLFPRLCGGCNRQLNLGEQTICTHCLYDLPYTDHHQHPDNIVARLFWGNLPVHSAMAMLYFRTGSKTQQLIHSLKYKGQQDIGIQLGKMMAAQFRKTDWHTGVDLIIPIPLHRNKLRKRGYNQSACIARGLADTLSLDLNTDFLIRHSATESQTTKTRYKRYQDLQNTFSVNHPGLLEERHVLLIDDVVTTGATLIAGATKLHQAGVKRISIAAAACAF